MIGLRDAFRGFAVALLSVVWACERPQPPPPGKDTAVPVVPPPESTVVTPPVPTPWDSSAGPALLVAAESPREAVVIVPSFTEPASLDTARFDSASFSDVRVQLYAAGRRVGEARVTQLTTPLAGAACHGWPTANLVPVGTDTSSLDQWVVGFAGGKAESVTVDSIETLASADSSKLAVDVARLASALPGDTAVAFRGLPFVVQKVWRFSTPSTGPALVAVVVRNVNQEANPRQQRLLLVAERDTAPPTARYRPVYTERVSGLEETVETTDPLAVVRLGEQRRPTIVLARESGNGTAYALLERAAEGWRVRWTSAYARC